MSWIYYYVNSTALTGAATNYFTWQSPVVTLTPATVDEGDYKLPPTDWHGRTMRRRRGQRLLLSMMDVYDRLEWYEHKCVRLQYPLRAECDSEYGGRTLLLTPKGNFEFYRKALKSLRNIWLATSGRADDWSLEDRYLGLIFAFQTDFRHFIQVGCRDFVYAGDYPAVEGMYAYGYGVRLRGMAAAKKLQAANT